MTREEAIEVLKKTIAYESDFAEAKRMAIEALSTPTGGDLISREALNNIKFVAIKGDKVEEAYRSGWNGAIECIIENAPSADAVQGWRTGKPKKQGEYTVTVKSMRGGMVEPLYYGKPLMPNCKVKGMCWYRSDDEWGDVVYDDADILAWMPLPKPYRGGDSE